MSNKNYKNIAQEVIRGIGGTDNIISMAHCATRLRLIVKDRDIIDDELIENIDFAKGFFFTSGQYQIIFGTGTVNHVYDAMLQEGVSGTTKSELKEIASDKDDNIF